jgi:hypothetical protein
MAESIQVTDEEIDVATKALHAMLDFIVKQLPRRVRRDNEDQLERARECLMNEEFDTSEKLDELADALLWSIDVIPQNYRGPVPVEIEEAFRVLDAWGYVSPEIVASRKS